MLVWRKGNIEKTVSVCLAVLCTVIMVHKDTNSSYRLVDCIFDLVWFSFLIFRAPLCLQSSWYTVSKKTGAFLFLSELSQISTNFNKFW